MRSVVLKLDLTTQIRNEVRKMNGEYRDAPFFGVHWIVFHGHQSESVVARIRGFLFTGDISPWIGFSDASTLGDAFWLAMRKPYVVSDSLGVDL